MSTILDSIIIFGERDAKREVVFREGLNVISGDSKTGKSALIEIIDYCLFSSRSTIPKGIITNFGQLYIVVMKVQKELIVIGRPGPDSLNSSKCYFAVETEIGVIRNLTRNYFDSLTLKPRKQAQAELEAHIGLSVSDTTEERQEGKTKEGKASMRNMMSFLFQHQNLIANKHALFYRFDDNNKRNATIEQWPIFMGWVDGEYYLLRRQLNEVERDIRSEERISKSLAVKAKGNKEQLRALIEEYCSIAGLKLKKDLPYETLLVLAQDLPDVSDMKVGNAEAIHMLKEYEAKRDKILLQKNEVDEQLNVLSSCKYASISYAQYLNSIYDRTPPQDNNVELQCPLCSSHVPDVNAKVKLAIEAKHKLEEELDKLGIYNVDNSGAIEALQKEKAELEAKLLPLNGQISRLNEYNDALKKHNDRKALANRYRGRIEWIVKEVLDATKVTNYRDSMTELLDKKRFLQDKLKGYDIDHRYEEANTVLAGYMNKICERLDFEEELKPPLLRLDTKTFDFYHWKDKKEQIHLYEMGSGANWLACHLSLFLGLLWYACHENGASIPKLLFVDQPSQVYFPKGDEKIEAMEGKSTEVVNSVEDENIKQVKNIFKVVKDVLEEISNDTGVTPQIILTEHADPVKLGLKGFDNIVIKRWTSDGEKLI